MAMWGKWPFVRKPTRIGSDVTGVIGSDVTGVIGSDVTEVRCHFFFSPPLPSPAPQRARYPFTAG